MGTFWYVCFGFGVSFVVGVVLFLGAGVGGIGVEEADIGIIILFSLVALALWFWFPFSLPSVFPSGEVSFMGTIFRLGVRNDRNCGQSDRDRLLPRRDPNFFSSSVSWGPKWLLVEP